ncbi:hypothetical protein [uncultured Clostridium sp.]|uniref:hypothetical protein n=1 Tax=uncultured Clostridium sp. TaxID=59620 RepID=UPI0025D20CC8|nr:hypothetical protein [uncultured Clostridium sp.]
MISSKDLVQGSKIELIKYAKREFNKRIERVKKAEEYFYNHNTKEEQIERSIGTLQLILKELSSIGNEIEELTVEKIDSDIAVNGFKGV